MVSFTHLKGLANRKSSINEYVGVLTNLKVIGNAFNIKYYFCWHFIELIHHHASYYFMVVISDEDKYKRLVKTTFKSCGKFIFLEIYHEICGFTIHQKSQFSAKFGQPHLLLSIEWDIIGSIVEFS